MNCTIIQRRLLGAEDAAHPPDEVQSHLDGCTGCREWHALLLQMEQNIALLPVPTSNSRAEFLQRLLHTPVAGSVNGTGPPLKIRVPELVQRRSNRKLNTALRDWMPVAGAAAALLLIVFGWLEFVQPPKQPVGARVAAAPRLPDPLVTNLMKQHLALLKATSVQARTAALAAMVRELDEEIRPLAAAPQTLELTKDLNRLKDRIRQTIPQNEFSSTNLLVAVPSQISPATAARVSQLQQNQKLIRSLIDSSVQLVATKETDSLAHATQCKSLVQDLAAEISLAANDGEGHRAQELSVHFRDLLQQGVADKLTSFRGQPGFSVAQREMKDIGDWSVAETEKLERQLKNVELAGVQSALEAVRMGRESIKQALKAEAA